MVTGTICASHYAHDIAYYHSRPQREVYAPEQKDPRFEQPGSLLDAKVPQADSILSTKNSKAVGAVVAILLTTDDDKTMDSCGKSLSLVPEWVRLSELLSSTSNSPLAVATAALLDKRSILAAATPVLDRSNPTYVREKSIAAHCKENLRLVGHSSIDAEEERMDENSSLSVY